MAYCLLPNVGLLFSVNGMLSAEKTGNGLSIADLDLPLNGAEDELSLGLVWLMFWVDTLVFAVVLWFMDKVKPGPYGTAAPVFFMFMVSNGWRTTSMYLEVRSLHLSIFQPSYWCKQEKLEENEIPLQTNQPNEHWETEPEGIASVKVRNLRKKFSSIGGKTVKAVKNVSFSAYPNQIMALLGHNGAGKTTTMSILSGLFSSSGGSVIINGNDIKTSMDRVRQQLGLCPQHNMLFPSLTVLEHLFFFGMVRKKYKNKTYKQS